MGLRGKVNELLRNYLENRIQRVKIGDCVSEGKIVTAGITQGTILRPLLFILYVNELLKEMPKDTILSYTDDTAVISTEDTWDNATNKMNNLLTHITIWLALNKF